jgi:hypothetical protein
MPAIGPQQLDVVLAALGEQLGAAGATAHLVVIGGSGLLASADPLPAAVRGAAALVARDLGLEAHC